MLVQAVLIGFIAMFVTFEWMLGTNLGSRPIITGVLVGLVDGGFKDRESSLAPPLRWSLSVPSPLGQRFRRTS